MIDINGTIHHISPVRFYQPTLPSLLFPYFFMLLMFEIEANKKKNIKKKKNTFVILNLIEIYFYFRSFEKKEKS